jgi:hypothetical protein
MGKLKAIWKIMKIMKITKIKVAKWSTPKKKKNLNKKKTVWFFKLPVH